jgi:proline iminopeptidase
MYFSLQFTDVHHKGKMDEIDKDFSSTPAFPNYVFSSDEYLQDFASITREIEQHVLVMASTHDHAVGPQHHTNFLFPNSAVKELESGHHPYVEHPFDFQEAVLNYFHNRCTLINSS